MTLLLHVHVIKTWISFIAKVVFVQMSLLLQMLLRQEEDTTRGRESPAENPDRDHLDGDDNNCRGDVIYILHASLSAPRPGLIQYSTDKSEQGSTEADTDPLRVMNGGGVSPHPE